MPENAVGPGSAHHHRRRGRRGPPAGHGRLGHAVAGHRSTGRDHQVQGLDALLSIVQMPAGVPVATVAIDNARNAGLLAVRMLGIADDRSARADERIPGEAGEGRP